jgi:hypothetical protein
MAEDWLAHSNIAAKHTNADSLFICFLLGLDVEAVGKIVLCAMIEFSHRVRYTGVEP